MSIAKIREALEHMKAIDTGDEMPKAMAALAEVEAIAKAARIVVCGRVYGGLQDEEAALALFEEIERQAREATALKSGGTT